MKSFIIFLSVLAFDIPLFAQVTVTAVKGDVTIRRGVTNEWLPVRVGDLLKPDDSMKSGERSSATIVVDGKKAIVLPENVILDIGDLRQLDRDDLLLKLAMERVRAVPDDGSSEPTNIPQATVVHGERKESAARDVPGERLVGLLRLNGVRVLFRNGYYGTCALKSKEVFRLYPEYSRQVEVRLMVAAALENVGLYGEALMEYYELAREGLSDRDRATVATKIEQLKAIRYPSETAGQ